jgi:hydroxylamine reductase
MNLHHVSVEAAKPEIEKFIEIFYNVVKRVYWCSVGAYGVDSLVDVSFTTRPGKAILISGNDLKELELLLKATEGKGIDVYTHGLEMLVAHSFPKIRAYKHLVGHFSRGIGSHVVDIASFPGPILMTRHTLQKTNDLYHGNIFTSDIIAPQGATKILNNDFSPLIKAAQEARGFSLGAVKEGVKVGYDEKEVIAKVNRVLDQMEEGKIKHLYFLGLWHDADEPSQYFNDFFKLVPDDCFVFSFSYNVTRENVYHLESYYDYSLVYKILKAIRKRKPLSEVKMTVFLTHCDKNTVANVINLWEMGVKNIFMCECPPVLINPPLIGALRNFFGLKSFTTPKQDIETTLIGEG